MKKDTPLSRFLASMTGNSAIVADAQSPEALTALQAEFDSFKTDSNALVGVYTAQVEELTAALEEAVAKNAELAAALAAADEAKVSAAAEAEAARMSLRKEKIVAAIGEAGSAALMTATEKMDDEAFNNVMSALGVHAQLEAKSPQFTEVGVDAGLAETPKAGESAEMKMLRAKYPQGPNA